MKHIVTIHQPNFPLGWVILIRYLKQIVSYFLMIFNFLKKEVLGQTALSFLSSGDVRWVTAPINRITLAHEILMKWNF